MDDKKLFPRVLLGLLLLALSLSLSGAPMQARAAVPEEGSMAYTAANDCLLTIDGGMWPIAEGAGHLQGVCCDDELRYMYFTFTDRLIKVDMRTGEIVGTVTGLKAGSISSGAHLGCLAYRDGYIYGSLEYKAQERWYIAIFDADLIQGDMHYTDPGVMYAVHVPDVDEDFKDELDAGEHYNSASSMGHRYGMGGIDGVTFGPLPGAGADSKEYLFLSYGPYGNSSRYDNNNMIINIYDPDTVWEYRLPFSEDRTEEDGARFEQQLFVYTGNQTFGIQNLEMDKDTGDIWMMCYGRPDGSAFPGGTMYLVDGSVPLYPDEVEVGQSVPDDNEDQPAALAKAACYQDSEGNYPRANHMTLKCICGKGDLSAHAETDYGNTGHPARICIGNIPASASTGFISLGDDHYYVASQGTKTVDGQSYYWGSVSLYTLNRENYSFSRVAAPARLLMSYTMDAADTYEKDGQVYLKDVSGHGFDALVEGTYAADDRNGNEGGALGFRGYRQGDVYDSISVSEEGMAYINEQVEDSFSYSFWIYNEREMDRFTPVIGMYRDNEVQQGLYAGVFEWRYRNSPCVSVHVGADNPEYVTLADGTVSISRPGPGGGDGSTYVHGESSVDRMGQWLHYVVVRAGSSVTIYCNGETTSSTGASVGSSEMDHFTNFLMGGGVTKNWRDVNTRTRFSGMLDDVRLYSGALTRDQAKALYASGPATGGGTGTGALSTVKDKVFAPSYSGAILPEQEDPILHYRMDETGTLTDAGGSGMDAVTTQWVTSAPNQEGEADCALAFDGHQFTRPTKVSMTDEGVAWLGAQLKAAGKFTVSFWMKATHENGHRMTVLGLYDKTGRPMGTFETRGRLQQNLIPDGKFAIGFTAASPYVNGTCDEATYEQLCTTDTTKDSSGDYGDRIINTWYHVVGELDQNTNTMRLFVNGELMSQASIADGTLDDLGYFLMGTPAGRYYEYENASNPSENSLTRQGWAMRGEYVGLLDDVRVYNRILSADEVAALYQAGTQREDWVIQLSPPYSESDGLLFDVTVHRSVTAGSAAVLLATYAEDGRMLEVQALTHCPEAGGTAELQVTFEKKTEEAVLVRAFPVASLSDPTPVFPAIDFPIG